MNPLDLPRTHIEQWWKSPKIRDPTPNTKKAKLPEEFRNNKPPTKLPTDTPAKMKNEKKNQNSF